LPGTKPISKTAEPKSLICSNASSGVAAVLAILLTRTHTPYPQLPNVSAAACSLLSTIWPNKTESKGAIKLSPAAAAAAAPNQMLKQQGECDMLRREERK
jgi:hypothetical protein